MLDTLSQALNRLGYDVTAVNDSLQAVELTRQQEFDLVITDVRMPGLDGLEALERVQQMQPDVRSLVVTGYSTEADSIRAIRLGVGEYLKKPFKLDQFREAVARLADKIKADERKIHLESAICQSIVWALEAVARNLRLTEDLSWVHKAGGLAYRLSLATGLPPRASALIQLVCLWWSLQEGLADGLPDYLRDSLPESVQPVVAQLQEGLETQDTMIVRAAQLLAQDRGLEELGEAWRGQLTAAAEAMEGTASALDPGEPPAAQRRSLLSLALALEDAGDLEGAGLAYRDLVTQEASREAAEAALGLARMAKQRGDKAALREFALSAVKIARSHGPLCLAGAGGQAGTLLASSGASEATAVLEEAAELLRRLGFAGREAQVRLAMGWLNRRSDIETHVEQILQHSYSGELAESAWWMLPVLLESCARQANPLCEQAALRVAREKPSACSRLLAQGSLSAPARTVLATLNPSPDVLRRLSNDPDEAVRRAANSALRREESPSPPTLRLFSLGVVDVFVGEEPIRVSDWKKKNIKALQLLICLASQEGRPVAEEALIEAFWPDEGPKGRQNFYSVRSILRRNLRSPDWPAEIDYIIKLPGGVALDPNLPHWHDSEELQTCLKRAQQLASAGHSETEMSQLRRAQQLYRGPFLENCYMDWALNIRQRLERQMVEALLRLGDLALQTQSPAEASECAQQILEIDNCNQDAYKLAMQACIRADKPVEAVRFYEKCQKVLRTQLQVEPAIPLVELYHRARLAL
jgi:two-component SAPR family response regulator